MRNLLFLLLFFCLISCKKGNTDDNADAIVAKVIDVAGGDLYENSEMSFTFRDIAYKSSRKAGIFTLERYFVKDGDSIQDILDNQGFRRFKNDTLIPLTDSISKLYTNSVNSVHYFVQLPYGLSTEAANRKLLGKDTINGKEYFEIEISFNRVGGGEDHEDEYLYWVNTKDYTIDYLAYKYEVLGGGIRFREAYNPRVVGGIRVVDYRNYKPQDLSTPLQQLDELFTNDQLEFISSIENEDVRVHRLN